MELEKIKKHLRVTHSYEDELIQDYYSWAEDEIKDSVSTSPTRNEEFFNDNKIYLRAVIKLTAYFYEERLAYSDINYSESPISILSSIQKLRGSYYEET